MKVTSTMRREKINNITSLKTIDDHNERKINEEKNKYLESAIERERTRDNITLIGNNEETLIESFKKSYEENFKKELEEFNNKQKRKDRKIDNYLNHVSERKKIGIGSEIILQFGDKELWEKLESENNLELKNKIGIEIAEEQLKIFKELNPNFKIVRATLHLDETSPHLHFTGYNTIENCKQGLKKQATAYLVKSRYDLSKMHEVFKQRTLEKAKEIFKNNGINIDLEQKEKGQYRKHLTVKEYKEKMQELKKEFKDIEEKLENIQDKKAKKFLGMIGKEKVTLTKEEFNYVKNLLHDLEQYKLSDKYEELNENIERVNIENEELKNKNMELTRELETLKNSKEKEIQDLKEIQEQNNITKDFIINEKKVELQKAIIVLNNKTLKEIDDYNKNKEKYKKEIKDLNNDLNKGRENINNELSSYKTAEINKKNNELNSLNNIIADKTNILNNINKNINNKDSIVKEIGTLIEKKDNLNKDINNLQEIKSKIEETSNFTKLYEEFKTKEPLEIVKKAEFRNKKQCINLIVQEISKKITTLVNEKGISILKKLVDTFKLNNNKIVSESMERLNVLENSKSAWDSKTSNSWDKKKGFDITD